mgnify:CR=1 FL=1
MNSDTILQNLEGMRRSWTASGADHDAIRATLAEVQKKLARLDELEAVAADMETSQKTE